MKYLFYIHSHITNLVAKEVIQHQKLKEEDCVFLLSRNYKTDFKNHIQLPYTHYPVDSFKVQVLFWNNWSKMAELDQWIAQLTKGDSFQFYTPQSGFNLFYLLVNHSDCKGYAYIEEGLCSYLPEGLLKNNKKEFWLRDRLYDLNFKNRAPSVKHFYDLKHKKYLGAFGISEHSFPGLPKKQVLKLPFLKNDLSEKIEHVLVLGQYVEYEEMMIETLLHALKTLLEKLIQEKVALLHVKFHPAQQEQVSILPIKRLFDQYARDIEIKKMNKEVILENVAFSTDADFYIVSSSVGIYASIAGSKVFSLAQEVANLEPKFQKKIDEFPDFLKKELVYL